MINLFQKQNWLDLLTNALLFISACVFYTSQNPLKFHRPPISDICFITNYVWIDPRKQHLIKLLQHLPIITGIIEGKREKERKYKPQVYWWISREPQNATLMECWWKKHLRSFHFYWCKYRESLVLHDDIRSCDSEFTYRTRAVTLLKLYL